MPSSSMKQRLDVRGSVGVEATDAAYVLSGLGGRTANSFRLHEARKHAVGSVEVSGHRLAPNVLCSTTVSGATAHSSCEGET